MLSTGQECCRHTEKLPEKEIPTIRSTLAAMITEALIDSVADTLAEMEAETPLADVKVETPLSALGDTLSKVEAETLRYTLPDVKAEPIVPSLADTVEGAKRETYTNKLANVKAKTRDEIQH